MPSTTRKRAAALAESAPAATGSESVASASADADMGGSAKRQKKIPLRSKQDKAGAGQAPATSAAANLVRFDDEGNADQELLVPAPAPALAVTREEVEGSDSDEAPEAVSTSKAAKEMMASAQRFQELAQIERAAKKKVLVQRQALFEKQALARKDKKAADEEAVLAGAGRNRAVRTQVPNVLPVEFLADSSSEDEGDASRPSGVVAARRARTVSSVERRLTRQGRGPRDEISGTTVHRIARNVDGRMAPKAKKHAQSAKDALLMRGRQPVKGKSSGFFQK
ncbi:hypothetical protein E4U42_007665 [Claviceps africana]|uniref:Uncharacterized protein n=1 Tax=Claviceps africana TaxID=83212 RepID=A0A8K0NG05_9HYPO|nr:hypothetical protein E4U42_007665 [Claviceps africana]